MLIDWFGRSGARLILRDPDIADKIFFGVAIAPAMAKGKRIEQQRCRNGLCIFGHFITVDKDEQVFFLLLNGHLDAVILFIV